MTTVFIILIMSLTAPTQTGYATQFGGRSDKWRGGPTPCLKRRVSSSDWGIAVRHEQRNMRWTKRARCGQLYVVRNPRNGKWVVAPVIDFGPWWSVPVWCRKRDQSFRREMYCRKRFGRPMVKLRPGWTYGNNVADATPPVMRALGIRGLGDVQIWRL